MTFSHRLQVYLQPKRLSRRRALWQKIAVFVASSWITKNYAVSNPTNYDCFKPPGSRIVDFHGSKEASDAELAATTARSRVQKGTGRLVSTASLTPRCRCVPRRGNRRGTLLGFRPPIYPAPGGRCWREEKLHLSGLQWAYLFRDGAYCCVAARRRRAGRGAPTLAHSLLGSALGTNTRAAQKD